MRRTLPIVFLFFAAAAPVLPQWESIGKVDSFNVDDAARVLLYSGDNTVTVSALAPDLIRVRYSRYGETPARTHAVVKTDWKRPQVAVSVGFTNLHQRTDQVHVRIQLTPLRITFLTLQGDTLNADDPRRGAARDGNAVHVWKTMPPDEYYYGFGEKAGRLNKRDAHLAMWNSDIPGYDADTDPLYQTIPFFYAVRRGRATGIFFDNSCRSSFDMGKEARDLYSFGAEGGDLDYYFFSGPDPKMILERYTELVGRMPLPPLWSLGYQQCRWSYTPDARVRELARTFREKKIPADVIYLDIDYMDGYRIFTWNRKDFPDPQGLVKDLTASGFKVAVIVDPGIKQDTEYEAFRTGVAGGHFLIRPDGSMYVGSVWPGECAFPDFSRDTTRRWWGDQFKGMIEIGVRGWWNDMNEPSVFDVPTKTIDLDVLHRDDGLLRPHAHMHNLYGLQMTQATYEGVKRLLPSERPFVLTRASFAGGQRYAAAWTGDNVSSWEHLRMAVPMCLNLSISGQPFVGADIGGFIGNPEGELLARWLQLGVFTPLMRAHTVKGSADQEPWSYGEDFESVNRKTIELRYRLLPYLYAAMEHASRTGIPPMRPLIFDDPSDGHALHAETEFFFGEDLVVAPVLESGQRARTVRLPRGMWYDMKGTKQFEGEQWATVEAPVDEIPIFVRSGSILPIQPVVQFVDSDPFAGLKLVVFPGDSGSGRLYEDDGRSFAYQHGEFLKRHFTKRTEQGEIVVSAMTIEGTYRPRRRFLELEILSQSNEPRNVKLNGRTLDQFTGPETPDRQEGWTFVSGENVVRVRMNETAEAFELRLLP